MTWGLAQVGGPINWCKRGMFVQAVDNGAMDEGLMETGQVTYCAEDGFKFQPKKEKCLLVSVRHD